MEQMINKVTADELIPSAPTCHNTMLADGNFGQSKSVITLQDVKNCIGFPDNSNIYISLAGMCDCWFGIEKQKGLSDSDSALIALDKLGEKILRMSEKF